jgi:hypothetical protein
MLPKTRRPKVALKRSEVNITNYINPAIAAMLRQVARSIRYPSVRAVLLLVIMTVASGGPASAAANEAEARAFFTKFVAAQNAHNAGDVKSMLWNSPSMLWFSRGVETRGRDAVAARFKEYYEGTWHLEPDMSQLHAADLGRRRADSCPHRFHARPSRQTTPGQHVSNQPNVGSRCEWLAYRFHPADRKHPTQIAAGARTGNEHAKRPNHIPCKGEADEQPG